MKSSNRKVTIAIALAGVIATIIAPLNASASERLSPDSEARLVWQRVSYPLSAPSSLTAALELVKSTKLDVTGIRFESDQIVGEYSLKGAQSPAAFLATFETMYGTQPTVVSVFADRRVVVDSVTARTIVIADELEVGRQPFSAAPPIFSPKFSQAAISEESIAQLNPPSAWVPENVYAGTFRVGPNSQIITNMVDWTGTSPANVRSDYAMEVEINLHNNATGTRGSVIPGQICGPNFRDQFIAKNYNWNSWSIGSNLGGLLSSYAYADLNDLFDSCGRNAMSIGIAFPQNIPTNALGGQLYTTIDAQIGVTSSSRLSGNVGLVERKFSCGVFSNPNTTNWTNCTGTFPDPSPPAVTDRSTLNKNRNWTAAFNKCWSSAGYGLVAPVAFSCF